MSRKRKKRKRKKRKSSDDPEGTVPPRKEAERDKVLEDSDYEASITLEELLEDMEL